MNWKKSLYVGAGVFLAIVVGAIYVTDRLNPSLITSNPYGFIEKLLSQWSLSLGAAGSFIAAMLALYAILQNRAIQEEDRRQVIHALHDEIHSNLVDIISLRYQVSEKLQRETDSHIVNTEYKPFQHIDTDVFDAMKNGGQLHRLGNIRMDIVSCYKLVKTYNNCGGYQPYHLELLAHIYEGLTKAMQAIEAKFEFLPHYLKEEVMGDNEISVTLKRIEDKLDQNIRVSVVRSWQNWGFAAMGVSVGMVWREPWLALVVFVLGFIMFLLAARIKKQP